MAEDAKKKKTDEIAFELDDADAGKLTGFNYAKAGEYTDGLRARLEKTGLTDIKFAEGMINPSRQRAVWFIPDGKNPAMTANYGDYIIAVVSKSVTGSHVLERRDGTTIDLRDEIALPAAGLLSDDDVDRALSDGSWLCMTDDFLFDVIAWHAGDFDKVYDQWDAYISGEAPTRPQTFGDALTMGVAMAVMEIDEIKGKVDEDLDSDSGEFELDDISDDDILASAFRDCVRKEYDAGGVRLYTIEQDSIADAIANSVLSGGEDTPLRDMSRWWDDNMERALRAMLPADCKACWENVARSAGKEFLHIGKIVIVVGQSWTLVFNARKSQSEFYIEPAAAVCGPDGKARPMSCLPMALATLSYDSGAGIGEAVVVSICGRLRSGVGDVFLKDFRDCRDAERILRTRRYLVPNDCNAVWWLCSKDAYAGIYDDTGIEKVDFSEAPKRIDEFDTFWMLPIRDVELPSGVAAIGSGAFSYMSRLSKVYVPDTVTSIGGGAFYSVGGRDGGKPLTVCFEGSEEDFGPFMQDYGDGVVARYGVTREEYRRMNVNESLSGDDGEGRFELGDVSVDDLAAHAHEVGKSAHMAAIKSRLEACGYSGVEFFQDVYPSRECAEWYCRSGEWNPVMSFSNGDGLSFTISAGGDHAVLINGEAYLDMDELAQFLIFDDDGLSRLEDLDGFQSFDGWCEFSVEVCDADGYSATSEEAEDSSIACTISEILDYVTDPGSVNNLIDTYRQNKDEARLRGESLNEDGSGDGEIDAIEIDDIASDDLMLSALRGDFAVEYDGPDGVVYTLDGNKAEEDFCRVVGNSMDAPDVEYVLNLFCAGLPERLRWAKYDVMGYLRGTIGNIHDRVVVAGGADWLVMFTVSSYSMLPQDLKTIPFTVEDGYGTERRPTDLRQALAANVGEADVGISKAVWRSRIGANRAGRAVEAGAAEFSDSVMGLAAAMRVSSSGEYLVPDDCNERTVDALDDSWCDAGNDIEVRFRDGLTALGGKATDTDQISLGFSDGDIFIANILCDHVKEIELPDGLRTIGSDVMLYLCNVRRIFVPKTVTAIGTHAFPRVTRGSRLTISFEGRREDYPEELVDRVMGERSDDARTEIRFGVSRAEFESLDEALDGSVAGDGQSGTGSPDDSDGFELADVGEDELIPTSVSDCVRKVYDGPDGELWLVLWHDLHDASVRHLYGDPHYSDASRDDWEAKQAAASAFAAYVVDKTLPDEFLWAVSGRNDSYYCRCAKATLHAKTASGRQAVFYIHFNHTFSGKDRYAGNFQQNKSYVWLACSVQLGGGLMTSMARYITTHLRPDKVNGDGSGYGEKSMLRKIGQYAYVMRSFETGVLTYPACSAADMHDLYSWDLSSINEVRARLGLDEFDAGRGLRVEFTRKASNIPYITLSDLLKQHIESIEFPDGVKTIGESDEIIFRSMPKLMRIFIPKGAIVYSGALSDLSLCDRMPTICLEDGPSSALARKIARVCEEECLRCNVTREQFRSMGGGQVAESLTEDSDGLELDDVPAEDLLSALPESDEAKELIAFLKDIFGNDAEFVTVGHRVYEVMRSGDTNSLPLVYSFDGEGILVCRLTFPSRDAEAAAAELVLNGIEPDGIDGMIEEADENYNSMRADSVPECIDNICDTFDVRDYAGYDDWKEQTGRNDVV